MRMIGVERISDPAHLSKNAVFDALSRVCCAWQCNVLNRHAPYVANVKAK
jgi:hypothetical protein